MIRMKLSIIIFVTCTLSIFLISFYGEILIENIVLKCLLYIIYFLSAWGSIRYIQQSKNKAMFFLVIILLMLNFMNPILFLPQFAMFHNVKMISKKLLKVAAYFIISASVILFIGALIFTGLFNDEREVVEYSPNGASRIVMIYQDLGAISSGSMEVTVEIDIVKNFIVMSRKLHMVSYDSEINLGWEGNQHVLINGISYDIYQ